MLLFLHRTKTSLLCWLYSRARHRHPPVSQQRGRASSPSHLLSCLTEHMISWSKWIWNSLVHKQQPASAWANAHHLKDEEKPVRHYGLLNNKHIHIQYTHTARYEVDTIVLVNLQPVCMYIDWGRLMMCVYATSLYYNHLIVDTGNIAFLQAGHFGCKLAQTKAGRRGNPFTTHSACGLSSLPGWQCNHDLITCSVKPVITKASRQPLSVGWQGG